MCHELGHNLGMFHDFLDPYTNPKVNRIDSKGVVCTNKYGVMDYYNPVQIWTTCSVEAFTNTYNNILTGQGSYCLVSPSTGVVSK